MSEGQGDGGARRLGLKPYAGGAAGRRGAPMVGVSLEDEASVGGQQPDARELLEKLLSAELPEMNLHAAVKELNSIYGKNVWKVIALLIAAAVLFIHRTGNAEAAQSKRSHAAILEFRRQHPCPATGQVRGRCPGWVIDHVIPLAGAYAAARRVSEARVATMAVNQGAFFERIRAGATCSVDTYLKVKDWFWENWPSGTEWPASVDKPGLPPAPHSGEAAA